MIVNIVQLPLFFKNVNICYLLWVSERLLNFFFTTYSFLLFNHVNQVNGQKIKYYSCYKFKGINFKKVKVFHELLTSLSNHRIIKILILKN